MAGVRDARRYATWQRKMALVLNDVTPHLRNALDSDGAAFTYIDVTTCPRVAERAFWHLVSQAARRGYRLEEHGLALSGAR